MTFEFKDLMGITVVAEPFIGADIEELTSAQANRSTIDRFITILARRIKRMGTYTQITEDFLVERIPLQNLNFIMFTIRNFSYGEPENFHFVFPYTSALDGKELTIELTEPLKGRNHVPFEQQVEEVDDFKVTRYVTIHDVEYQWTIPTASSIKSLKRIKRKDLNGINLLFLPRQVKKKVDNDGTIHWVVVDPKQLSLPHLAKLKAEFEKDKVICDTYIKFDHPEADFVEPEDAVVELNMLDMGDFFLDSASQ